MALPKWTEFNKTEIKKIFEVSAFVSAFHYITKPYFEPYFEKYDFSQIFLVLKGKGTYTARGKSYPIERGMMFYRPGGEESMYEWSVDDVDFALISFVCEVDAMEAFCPSPIKLYEEETAILLDIIKTGERVCEPIKENEPVQGMKPKDDVPDVVWGFISSSLERFLSMVWCRLKGIKLVVDESGKASRFIDETSLVRGVKEYLAENVAEKLSIKSLCAHFGVGQTTLMKKFKEETGLGVMEYFMGVKIERAKEMIAKTSMDFFEIADHLGFSSANYFSRAFKHKVGMTPTEYSRHVSKRRTLKS